VLNPFYKIGISALRRLNRNPVNPEILKIPVQTMGVPLSEPGFAGLKDFHDFCSAVPICRILTEDAGTGRTEIL